MRYIIKQIEDLECVCDTKISRGDTVMHCNPLNTILYGSKLIVDDTKGDLLYCGNHIFTISEVSKIVHVLP